MSTVTDKTALIRTAVYGKDVREALASGIEAVDSEVESTTEGQTALSGQFNSLVINAGSSNAEIVAGRTSGVTGQTSDTLGHRVDGIDSSLAQKANIVDVNTQIANVASGSPKGVYATLALLQSAFPTGNTNMYVVTADGKWYTYVSSAWTAGGVYQSTGIANGTVLIPQLENKIQSDAYTISLNNMYNPYNSKLGMTDCLNVFTADGAHISSEKLAVIEGKSYFFTESGTALSARFLTLIKTDGTPYCTTNAQIAYVQWYTIPVGVAYMIVTFSYTGSNKFGIVDYSPFVYEPYYISKFTAVNSTINANYSTLNTAISSLQTIANWYNNKMLLAYGDSITGQGMWEHYVVTKLGLTNFVNNGVGGRTLISMATDAQIATITATFDFMTILGGTNDWAQSLPMGDIDSSDVNTFYGALNALCQKIITIYPTSLIIFMTPTYALMPNRIDPTTSVAWADTTGYKNLLGLTTGDYGNAIISVAKKYGMPCIDLYANVGWNNINISTYVNSETSGTVIIHPNDLGGKRIANVLVGKLKSIEPVS